MFQASKLRRQGKKCKPKPKYNKAGNYETNEMESQKVQWMDKPVARMTKEKRKQILSEWERMSLKILLTSGSQEVWLTHANKSDNLGQMDKFPDNQKLSKLTENLNNSIYIKDV